MYHTIKIRVWYGIRSPVLGVLCWIVVPIEPYTQSIHDHAIGLVPLTPASMSMLGGKVVSQLSACGLLPKRSPYAPPLELCTGLSRSTSSDCRRIGM